MKKELKKLSPKSTSTKRSNVMKAIRLKGNLSTEVKLRLGLVRAGLRNWVMHPQYVPGKPDFYFVKERVAIFVDGCFWHGCPFCGHIPKTNSDFWITKISLNKIRDKKINLALKRLDVVVLRFWEHSMINTHCIVKSVINALNQKGLSS